MKIIFTVNTGRENSEVKESFSVLELGFGQTEWLQLSNQKRDNALTAKYNDWVESVIDGDWAIVV